MPVPFSRSLRSLEADSARRPSLWLGLVALFLGVWIWWFFNASLSVYELSNTARLEVQGASHIVDAPVSGPITLFHMELGQQVQPGDVLVEIDARVQERERAEQEARLGAARAQIAVLSRELGSLRQAKVVRSETGLAAEREADARLGEVQTATRVAEEMARRSERLRQEGLTSDLELLRAQADAEQRKHAESASRIGLDRLRWERIAETHDRQASIDNLARMAADLQGVVATAAATIARLDHEISRRTVRAPIGGRLGAVTLLRPGSVLNAGDRVAVVVPDRGHQIVAYFDPTTFGRIRLGQHARVRLDGFPWTHYGMLQATVSHVAGELWNNQVRVELDVSPTNSSSIPIQHGEPGIVEVEVERLSPAALVFRGVGRILRPTDKPSSAEARP